MEDIIVQVTPPQANDLDYLKRLAQQLSNKDLTNYSISIKKRSIDARKRDVKINLTLAFVEIGLAIAPIQYFNGKSVHNAEIVHIIGAGPAGLFAALAKSSVIRSAQISRPSLVFAMLVNFTRSGFSFASFVIAAVSSA